MDIQKEREVFEAHLKKMGKTDSETFSIDEDGSYQMDIVHFGWRIWQSAKAQAVPEGFVLMPMVPSERMVNAVRGCYEGEAYLPYSLYSEFVNQAMIEAQEPAND